MLVVVGSCCCSLLVVGGWLSFDVGIVVVDVCNSLFVARCGCLLFGVVVCGALPVLVVVWCWCCCSMS